MLKRNQLKKWFHSLVFFNEKNADCRNCSFYRYCHEEAVLNRYTFFTAIIIFIIMTVVIVASVQNPQYKQTKMAFKMHNDESYVAVPFMQVEAEEEETPSKYEIEMLVNYEFDAQEKEETNEVVYEEIAEEPQYEENIKEESSNEGFSDYDIYLIERVVYNEARGESFDGQASVASTILNRLEYGYWGDTIEQVVFAEAQFAADYVSEWEIEQVPSIAIAVEEAINGYDPISPILGEKVLYFYSEEGLSDYQASIRSGITAEVQLGGHWFYGLTGESQMG